MVGVSHAVMRYMGLSATHCLIASVSLFSTYFRSFMRSACLILGNLTASPSGTGAGVSVDSGMGLLEYLLASWIESKVLNRDPLTLLSLDLASPMLLKRPAPGEDWGTATA